MSKIHELAFNAEEIDELLDSVDKKTIYQDATQSEHGLMSATDKSKLDALPTAQQIDDSFTVKVDKEEGKGLSTNDYTDADKAKVASALQSETDPTVPSWAKQPNKPSYDYSEIGNTPDISGFITKSVNDLTNYYLKSETYTKAEVAALIGAIQQFHYEIYATLPQSGESNVLYLIGPTGSGSDRYEEYVYANNAFTKIGDTSIDLSGYVTTSALNTALADYTTTANLTTLLSNKADKVSNATNGNFAGLDANGNLNDSGSKASDFATASQGAKADTAYQKPSSGIPETDLSSDVQQALQKHFKGWLESTADLPVNPVVGDYAYVEDNGTTYIYRCSTNGEWPTTSTEEKEPADVTFANGKEVNEVHIVNDLTTGGTEDVLSAEQGKVIDGLRYKINPLYSIETIHCDLPSTNKYTFASNKESWFIPVSAGDTVKVYADDNSATIVAFIKSIPLANGDTADYATDSSRKSVSAGSSWSATTPNDAKYLYVRKYVSSGVGQPPKSLTINGYDIVQGLYGNFESVHNDINKKGVFCTLYPSFVPNISVADRTLTIKSGTAVAFNEKYYVLQEDAVINLAVTTGTSSNKVIFDWSDKSFSYKAYNKKLTDTQGIILLLKTDYVSSGEFTKVQGITCSFPITVDNIPYYASGKDVADLEDNVNDIQETINASLIPDYYVQNVNDVVTNARKDLSLVGMDGESFIFITDIHWEVNTHHSLSLVRDICKSMQISNVVFGGDAINGQANQDTAREYFSIIASGLSQPKSRLAACFGNHDYNGSDGGTVFTKIEETFYGMFLKSIDDVAVHGGLTYYYFDNPTTKTRNIVLDTHSGYTIDSTQLTWLESVLSSTDDDTNILIFLHAYMRLIDNYFVRSDAGNTLEPVIDAYKQQGKKIQFVMTGHCHLDTNYMTEGMIPIIAVDSDTFQTQMQTVTRGTVDEQAFDVDIVDYYNKVLRCNRVGRGKSRIIHYTPYTLSVGGTLDISSLIEITPSSYSTRDNYSLHRDNDSLVYDSTNASIDNNGVVTAISEGYVIAVAENDDCIETFNVKITE